MTSERWKQYFDFTSIDNNRTNGHCKLCNQDYKDKIGIYSNFLKHLKRRHSREYDRMFSNDNEYSSENIVSENTDQQPSNLSLCKSKQNRINAAIAKYLIIKCNLPLSLVENNSFRDFLKECSIKWNPISAKTLKLDSLRQYSDKVSKTIYETLQGVEHMTLTVDGWSDRRCRSFLGITSHFINEKIQPEAYLIDFVRLKSPHTGENIHHITESVLDRLNIKEKVYQIITDNASSMIKAYKFGLAVSDDVDEDDIKSLPDVHNDLPGDNDDDVDVNDFFVINVQYDDDDDDFNMCDNPSDVRLACFAHTLQLCIRDGLKNATYVPKVLGKCKAVAKFSHKSCKVADLLEQLNKNIHKYNLTRWNSEFMLIKSIVSVGKDGLELITSSMENPIKFSNNDFIVLGELIDILDPFCDISIKCQTDHAVTASLVVPSITHLIGHLRDMKENVKFCSKLVQQLQESIKARFSGMMNRLHLVDVVDNGQYGDPLYFVAAVLDPSFKFYWIQDLQLSAQAENCLKQNIIRLIIDEMNKDIKTTISALDQSNISSTSSSSSYCSSTPKPKRRKLFHYDDSNNNSLNESTSLDPAVELDAYLNDPIRASFSDYWFHSQLHMLRKLVKRIFSVQASSAPIERVFSQAGIIFSNKRTNMSEKLFRDLVYLRVNQNLL